MALGTRKRRDLSRARSAVLAAIKTAEGHLSSTDPQVSLRAATAIAQLAGALGRLAEVMDLEERLSALENLVGQGSRVRRSA